MDNRYDKGFYKSKKWLDTREKVLQRDGRRCVNCGIPVRERGSAVVDHIISRRERPDLSLDLNNLQTLCRRCDNHKHHGDKLHKGKGEYKVWETGSDGLPVDPNHPFFKWKR